VTHRAIIHRASLLLRVPAGKLSGLTCMKCLLRIQMSVYHLTYHLTIYKRVLLGKLTVSFLVNKYPVFNAIRIFNKVFTMAVYWYCTSLKPDEFILYRSVLALFSLFQHYFLICTSVHISSLLHS